MEIERRALLRALRSVRAHRNAIFVGDAKDEGCVEIAYVARPLALGAPPRAVSAMTIRAGGLFGGGGRIGLPISTELLCMRDAVSKSADGCVIEGGRVNGCDMAADTDGALSDMENLEMIFHGDPRSHCVELDLGGDDYAAAAKDCMAFAARDFRKSPLCGERVALREGRVELVATDGVKMVERDIPMDGMTDGGAFTVPIDAMFAPADERPPVRIKFYEKFGELSMSTEGFDFVSRFMLGDMGFPDYKRAIPSFSSGSESLELDAQEFAARMEGVHSAIVTLDCGGDGLVRALLSDVNGAGGEGAEDMGVVAGCASRAMSLRIRWEVLRAALDCGGGVARMALDRAEGPLVMPGANVVRLFMPLCARRDDLDEWGLPSGGPNENHAEAV